jgi:hypothetical protein
MCDKYFTLHDLPQLRIKNFELIFKVRVLGG